MKGSTGAFQAAKAMRAMLEWRPILFSPVLSASVIARLVRAIQLAETWITGTSPVMTKEGMD
jgi:hypothetical protein